jgi:hypothetical protein
MGAEKYSASMDDALLAAARADAEAEGLSLSAWLADAAADRLRVKALRQMVDEWEAEHGAISTAELEALESKVVQARCSGVTRLARTQAVDARRPGAS